MQLSVLCICPLDHWVPNSLFRLICPAWRPCLWVVSLGFKSRCLGAPWPRPLLPGGTGPNRHHNWLRTLFCAPNSYSQSQQDGSRLLQKIAEHSLLVYLVWALPCPLAPVPLQWSQLSVKMRSPLFHCHPVTPSLWDSLLLHQIFRPLLLPQHLGNLVSVSFLEC